MKLTYRLTLFALSAASLVALTGCSHPRYYAAGPPPPPAYGPSPLVQMADGNGFRGHADGERDLYQNRGYAPRRDGRYKATPGYDGRLGPFPVYRDQYRMAYLRGYDQGFRRG